MQPLWLLTKKNLKLLVRAKSSALIVFFAPLLTILILGLSYNSSQYGLNVGVHASSSTEDVNSFINSLQEQQFKVVKYEKSIDECIEDIKIGAVHTCISLPDSFSIESNQQKEIAFYVDPSKINLVWMIQENLKSKFNLKSQEISQQLSQDLLSKIDTTKTGISDQKSEVSAIKEKGNTASTSAEQVKNELISIDWTVPASTYDLSVIASFKSNLSSSLNASKGKITDAETALSEIVLNSSDRDILEELLDNAKDQISNSQSLVSGSSGEKVSEVLAALENDLKTTKEKLTAASTTIGGATTNLDSVTSGLSESLAAMDNLQASLEKIHSELDAQKVTSAATIASPLTTKVEKVAKDSTYLNYSFSTLLVLVIMFTSLLLGTILVMMEKNSSAFIRNYFLPVKKITFITSIYLTNIIIMLVQIVVILLISLFFLREALPVLPPVVLILFVSTSVFTFLGMTLGYLFKSEETGILASISAGSVLLFISGVVLPIETISPALREITAFNPFVVSEKLIREIFIFKSSLVDVGSDLLVLIAYAVALFGIILLIESSFYQRLKLKFGKEQRTPEKAKEKNQKQDI